MTPSAPMPALRSVIRRTCWAVTSWVPSRSATSTKSFSVPWPLVNRSSRMSVISAIVHLGHRPSHHRLSRRTDDVERVVDQSRVIMVEPVDPRVRPEPRPLAASELAGCRDRVLDGLLSTGETVEVCQGLAVAKSLCRSATLPQAGRIQPLHLVEQADVPHLVNPGRDAHIKLRPRDPKADRDRGEQVFTGWHRGRERPAGDLDDLESPNDPPVITGLDGMCRNGIQVPESREHDLDAHLRELIPQATPHPWISGRNLQAVEHGADIESGSAGKDRRMPARPDTG